MGGRGKNFFKSFFLFPPHSPEIMEQILNVQLEQGGLRFLLCRASLREMALVAAAHVPFPFAGWPAFSPALQAEMARLIAAERDRMGNARTRLRLCLPVDAAVFRPWSFPFRSRTKVRRAVELLRETELPFNGSGLDLRLHRAGRTGIMRHALAVGMMPGRILSLTEALSAEGLVPECLTVMPFPILEVLRSDAGGGSPLLSALGRELSGLPVLEKLFGRLLVPEQDTDTVAADCSLLLHTEERRITLALLDHGRFRHALLSEAQWPDQPDQETLSRISGRVLSETRILVDSTGLEPEQLLVSGSASLCPQAVAACAAALRLPVHTIDRLPFSLVGPDNNAVPGIAGSSWGPWLPLLGLAVSGHVRLFGRSLFPSRPLPFLEPAQPDFSPARARTEAGETARFLNSVWGKALIGIAAVGCAWLFALWGHTRYLEAQATESDKQMRRIFQQALPELKGNFNTGQMLSILTERITALNAPARGASPSGRNTLEVLRTIHALAPKELAITLSGITIDSQRCLLVGSAGAYAQVEAFRETLAAAPEFSDVRIVTASAQKQEDQVAFELECRLREQRQ